MMSSIIEGYNYDIFISYRQKDNKGDRWVSEFVDSLKTELESTFKEDISIYFDENPHDGLLETHDVDASLKEKLKCLVFIPVISKTFCDPKAFAWQHEFLAFIEQASTDRFGMKVTLPNGNVAMRVLPVKIHELGLEDMHLCDAALGGTMRGIDFIYKAPGVNRPLRQNEDHPKDNLNKTYYRDQINKVANAIDEIIQGLRNGRNNQGSSNSETATGKDPKNKLRLFFSRRIILNYLNRRILLIPLLAVCIIISYIIYNSSYLKQNENTFTFVRLNNLNNDSSLFNDAANFIESINEKIYLIKEITLRPVFRDQNKGISMPLSAIRKKVRSNYILDGNIRKDGQQIRIYVELTSSRKNKVVLTKPIIYERSRYSNIAVDVVKDIAKSMGVRILPEEEKLMMNEPSSNPEISFNYISANKDLKDAWYFYNYGDKLHDSASFITSIESYDKIIKDDPTAALPYAKRAIARSFGFYLEQLDSSNISLCKKDIDKALELDKNLAELDIAQGFYYYYCLDENELAFDFFKSASRKDPGSYKPLFYMALAARRMGKWDECLSLIRQVIKYNPQEALFLTNIGMTFAFFHNYDSAIIYQDKAIDLIPGWAAGYKNKFESIILKNGLTSDARKLVDDAIEKTGDRMTEYKILIKIYERKYSEAISITEEADPQDFELPGGRYLYLAMLSELLNNHDKKEFYYKQALSVLSNELEKDKDDYYTYGNLSLVYAGLGDRFKAYEEAKKAIRIAYNRNRMDESDMKIIFAQVYTTLGEIDNAYPYIQYLLNNPSFFSKKLLMADPVWKPILENRDYRKKIR